MDYQVDNHCFGYTSRYITDRSAVNGVFNDKPGRKNDVMPCFQTNNDSVYSIMMIASVLGGIVKNVGCQRAFVIVTLDHHQE